MDINKIRKDFPMLNNKLMQGKPLVYLDNASTTFKPQCVIDAEMKYYSDYNANSHRGDYDLAYSVDREIEETRRTIASFINCDANEVVFTYGTTMSINTITYGYGDKFIKKGDEIIIDENEHASNVLPWFKLAERTGAIIKYIPLEKNGLVTINNLEKVISNKTKIVALAQVSNVLGVSIDIKEFAKVVHSYGAIFAVDGAQSVPHMKVDFKDSDIDFLSFSAHKMCGPTGVGCLIGKNDLLSKMDSFITGGGMNFRFYKDASIKNFESPMKFEAGTLNIAGIIGFKAAIEYIQKIGIDNIQKHDFELHRYLVDSLRDNKDIIIYNSDIDCATFVFNRKNVFAQDEATLLNSKGIAVRSGEHCAKLMEDFLGCNATCRVSTYFYTTKEEIDAFIQAINEGGDILDAYFN